MTKTAKMLGMVSSLVLMLGLSTASMAQEAKKELTPLEQGKDLAWNRGKGNCLACHSIVGADMPGTIGPPLIGMKFRFPDKKKLYDFIYDPTSHANSGNIIPTGTIMPPFGKNLILSDKEIQLITDYIHTL
jgi:sulfur-oxidizing protein SoxX